MNFRCPASFAELAEGLYCDAMLAATGESSERGAVNIRDVFFNQNVSYEFIADYAKHARHDVVGQLFLADSRIVECVSIADYDDEAPVPRARARGKVGPDAPEETTTPQARGDRRLIRDYVQTKGGYNYLLLAGLNSSYGLAWITAYKLTGHPAFTPADVEYARYYAPALLYRWQIEHVTTRTLPSKPPALVPLTSKQLRIAVLEAEGYGPTAIASKVSLERKTVDNHLGIIRTALGVEGRHVTLKDLERYAGRNKTVPQ
jgi:DNA-binding CsgD family transcriptional regulator